MIKRSQSHKDKHFTLISMDTLLIGLSYVSRMFYMDHGSFIQGEGVTGSRKRKYDTNRLTFYSLGRPTHSLYSYVTPEKQFSSFYSDRGNVGGG